MKKIKTSAEMEFCGATVLAGLRALGYGVPESAQIYPKILRPDINDGHPVRPCVSVSWFMETSIPGPDPDPWEEKAKGSPR